MLDNVLRPHARFSAYFFEPQLRALRAEKLKFLKNDLWLTELDAYEAATGGGMSAEPSQVQRLPFSFLQTNEAYQCFTAHLKSLQAAFDTTQLLCTLRAYLSELARRPDVPLAGRPLAHFVPLLQRECECFARIPSAERERVRSILFLSRSTLSVAISGALIIAPYWLRLVRASRRPRVYTRLRPYIFIRALLLAIDNVRCTDDVRALICDL